MPNSNALLREITMTKCVRVVWIGAHLVLNLDLLIPANFQLYHATNLGLDKAFDLRYGQIVVTRGVWGGRRRHGQVLMLVRCGWGLRPVSFDIQRCERGT